MGADGATWPCGSAGLGSGALSKRKLAKIQRQVANTLSSWAEPHGHGKMSDNGSVGGVDVNVEGEVKIAITPKRAHCPCCLIDLANLRLTLLEKKGITSAHIEIVGVPASDRWTKTINGI